MCERAPAPGRPGEPAQVHRLAAERDAERQTLRVSLNALQQALESKRQHKAALRDELDWVRRPWWRRFMRAA
jgi:hypothetical protein